MSTIDTIHAANVPSQSSIMTAISRRLAIVWQQHLARRSLRRTRLDLFSLSDSELKDIGITRQAADQEAARSLLAYYLNNSR